MNIKEILDKEVKKRNIATEVNQEKLDPIIVAHKYNDESVALICALFSYGSVKQIVKFLESLDFSLLTKSDDVIRDALQNHYYRFQKSEDIIALFIALKRFNVHSSLEAVFLEGYLQKRSVLDGLSRLIERLRQYYTHNSSGYDFLLSKVSDKTKGAGALKRWMMYLRWMVRDDAIDMGLWQGVTLSDLIIPLDTHTFHTSQRLGLLKRKTYDLQAAIELTEKLKEFDGDDPLKYDFALYRLGQEKIL
ncbi:MAG: TIGR02757 family protein [Campylobacterales bacterium]|nr:TIGR02757 family protein [Campylobacterales bacterium]